MQRGKVLRKASHQKELNDIIAVSIRIGLRWWQDGLMRSIKALVKAECTIQETLHLLLNQIEFVRNTLA